MNSVSIQFTETKNAGSSDRQSGG